MNREKSIKDWNRLFLSLTDPIEKEKAKRKTAKEKRAEEKRKDTGL